MKGFIYLVVFITMFLFQSVKAEETTSTEVKDVTIASKIDEDIKAEKFYATLMKYWLKDCPMPEQPYNKEYLDIPRDLQLFIVRNYLDLMFYRHINCRLQN